MPVKQIFEVLMNPGLLPLAPFTAMQSFVLGEKITNW